MSDSGTLSSKFLAGLPEPLRAQELAGDILESLLAHLVQQVNSGLFDLSIRP